MQHGVAGANPGVHFAPAGENFSHATSFPQPILTGAAFDDQLVHDVASVISTEARAFNNFGFAGIDFFTPNINPFRDPRWGRGQETPGEDPLHISRYVYHLVTALQGGVGPSPYYKARREASGQSLALTTAEGYGGLQTLCRLRPGELGRHRPLPLRREHHNARLGRILHAHVQVVRQRR